MADSFTLLINFKRSDGLVVPVTVEPGQSIVLGRDLGCDVRLDGRKVSRRHLRLDNRSEAIVLVDNGSHNGTFINGQRVAENGESLLGEGDLVQAGEWEGKVELRSTGASLPRPRATVMPAMQLPSESPPPSQLQPATNVLLASEWKWEEGSPSPEALRIAPVQDNPIIRRFAESQVNLDFRRLTEMSLQMPDPVTTAGLRPAAQPAIDGIALRLVFKVTEALAASDSMDQFLAEMCESLQGAARARAVIVLLPDDSGALVPRVVKLRQADERVQLSRTVIEHATKNKAALTTEDASSDERFARGESVLRFDLKAVLCCPLIKDDTVTGALYLTRDLPFSNTERDLVAALGQLIAMGLERSKLREQYAAADRTRRSLERFHAPDVVRRLMMESSAQQGARGDGLFLEPLVATVLFCDLAGFTKWCEGKEPEQVGQVLNTYLGAMTEVVFAHGGTVDKFIGDAIMCIFGAPFVLPDDPTRAVRCAIQMRRSFRALVASGACGEQAHGLDVHIGVNTGKVVAGTVGSPKRMEYTALGDTVNIAARLEGVAIAGQIVIGPATAAHLRDQVQLRSLGPVMLKGKREPLEVFDVPDVPDKDGEASPALE